MTDDVTVSCTSTNPPGAAARSGETASDSQAGANSPDQSIGMAREGSNFPPAAASATIPPCVKGSPTSDEVPTREPVRDLDVKCNSSESSIGMARIPLPEAEQPSLGRRIFRSIAGFFTAALTAFLIGILVISAWQSHGDEAKAMVKTWASSAWQSGGDDAKRIVKEAWTSSLDWLMKKLPPDGDIAGKQKSFGPAGQVSTRDAALSGSVVQHPVPVAKAVPFDSVQQLKMMAQDLIVVRQKLEQLAAAQQQVTQKVASLQALQQDIKQTASLPPSSPAVSVPLRKNGRPVAAPRAPRSILRDWWISDARNGQVYVQGHGNIYRVVPGTPLPGLGAVEQIKRENSRWVVMTPRGIIALMRHPESDDDTFDGD